MYQSLQGNYGLGTAIAYFTSHKIPVCLPLNDTQKYDLVVDMDGELKRVSVKTGKYQAPSGAYAIQLKILEAQAKVLRLEILIILLVIYCSSCVETNLCI